jgi:hypothetical protein
MPNFEDLEDEAKNHSKQVDEGIDKVEKKADEEAGGKDHGLIDEAAQEGEKELGGGTDGPPPDSTSPM